MASPTLAVPPEVVQRVRALVDQRGDREACQELGLSTLTVFRILAGWPVTRGTLLQLEQALPAAP